MRHGDIQIIDSQCCDKIERGMYTFFLNTPTTGGGHLTPPLVINCVITRTTVIVKVWNFGTINFVLLPCCSKQFESKMLSIKTENETFSKVTKRKIIYKTNFFLKKFECLIIFCIKYWCYEQILLTIHVATSFSSSHTKFQVIWTNISWENRVLVKQPKKSPL